MGAKRKNRSPWQTKTRNILTATLLFEAVAFLLIILSKSTFDYEALVVAVLLGAAIVLMYLLVSWITPNADSLLMALTGFLIMLGIVMQYRMDPEVAKRQLMMLSISIVALVVMLLLMRRPIILRSLSIPLMVLSIGILVALLFVGNEAGGAVNWISIGGILFQPSEFVKVALLIILANAMMKRTSFLSIIVEILFVAAVVALLVLQRDLGAAMLIAGTFLIMFFVGTGDVLKTFIGIGVAGAGAYASYKLFSHVQARVAIWIDPWATYSTSGYQIAQGLMAIASGGLMGMGFTLGQPKLIPAYHNDYIFAVICEEFGIIFGIGIIALYLLFVIRGILIALNARDRFSMLLAFGATALIAIQTFIIIGGVIKLIPLTGITLPFISSGGSSLIASMMLLGILQGIAANSARAIENTLENVEQSEVEA